MSSGRRQSASARGFALALLVSLAPSVWAHEQSGQAAGFVTGLLHPLSGLDHVLAMVAVGLWGAQLGLPAIWLLPVTFPLVMAFGGFLALIGVPLPGVEVGIAASAILLGAMVGGVGEYLALVTGYRVLLVAIALCYLAAIVLYPREKKMVGAPL